MILKIGNSYSITEESYEIHENLPLGVYQLTKRLDGEYDLIKIKDLSLPNKLYGDLSIVDKWIKSFNTFDKNLGILLSGLKGSGKTIYAKKFCIDSKRPVILINEPISGESFNRILSAKELNGSVIFIDEYEKIYNDRDKENLLLSILDGQVDNHLAFVLTVNESSLVSSNIINRPGRIKYLKSFGSLDSDTIDQVIQDRLDNQKHKDDLVSSLKKLDFITYDILNTIIDEINVFDEPASICCKNLNLSREDVYVKVFEEIDGISYDTNVITKILFSDSDGSTDTSIISFYLSIDSSKNNNYISKVEEINKEDEIIKETEYISGYESDINMINDNEYCLTKNNRKFILSKFHLSNTTRKLFT